MDVDRGVVHVYRNRRNFLIKLHDIRYNCECDNRWQSLFGHSIIVRDEHVIQCCAKSKLVSILNHSGELLQTIPKADILGQWPILRQIDVEGNFLIADRYTNRLVIARADRPSSRWLVVDLPVLPDSAGCRGAVWFRHRLFVADHLGRLITFTPVDA